MNLKKISFIIILPFYLTGCFWNSPQSKETVYRPKPVNITNDDDYQQVENYVKLKTKKMVEMVYKNNFIKRTIATNERELGYKTIEFKSYRVFKHVKIKKEDLDVFANPAGFALIPRNNLTQSSLIKNNLVKLEKPYFLTIVSFNNKTKKYYFNYGYNKFMVLINKSSGNINVLETNPKICRNLAITCFIDPERINLENYDYFYIVLYNDTIYVLDKNYKLIHKKEFKKEDLIKEIPLQINDSVVIIGKRK